MCDELGLRFGTFTEDTKAKKYLTSRCLVRLPLDVFPFSANSIVLLLSWYIVVVGTCLPCAAKKCLVHSTCAIESSIATSSASVELFVFSFVCWMLRMLYLSLGSLKCHYDFSCQDVPCTNCPPTIWACRWPLW